MRSLLLNGYIDEHYDDYISLFHGVNLTKEDFAFERKIKSGYALSFDYRLDKVENLVKRIPDKYFRKEEILNYQLIIYLLRNANTHKTKFNYFFSILSVDREKQFEFIKGFLSSHPDEIGIFIRNICIHKPTLWSYITNKSGLPEDQILNFIRHIFEHVQLSIIVKLNELESLNRFLEEMPGIFSFCATFKDTNNFEQYISKKGLLFKTLDVPTTEQKGLFELIYSKSLFAINLQNIRTIVQVTNPTVKLDELNYSNYTTIVKLKLHPLKEYLDKNMDEYILNVMTQQGNTGESEETMIDVLNRDDITLELKRKVLDSQEVTIQSINDIDEFEIKKLIISKNKIGVTWTNVFDYYDSDEENEEFDDIVVSFLNDSENNSILCKTKLTSLSTRGEDYVKKASNLILRGKGFTIEAYTRLLDSLPYTYNSIRYTEYNNDKVDRLLSKKKLALTAENHKGLKAKDIKFSTHLIEIHQNEFIKNHTTISLDSDDWEQIFKSSVINNQSKLSLIKNIDDSIIVNSNIIAAVACEVLPTESFIPLSYEVLNAMFKSNNSINKRIRLLKLHWNDLDDSQVQSLVELLGDNYAKMFLKQHKPIFPNNALNIDLFNELKERDLIMRFEEKEKDKGKLIKVFAKYSDQDES
jgi:hypothetical protein